MDAATAHQHSQATRVQAWWRMTVLRRAYVEARAQWLQMKAEASAGAEQSQHAEAPAAGASRAAIAIQSCWRSYMNTRIFRYYRDLISFQERGMPNQLLRCVNPSEARLLDAATRTHVRFRLGGATFPPTIYYKVFCHGGMLDVGSFAPRDYTAQGSKAMLPRHNIKPGDALPHHNVRAFLFTQHDGWYRRQENNNWRPMSMKLVEEGLDLHLRRGEGKAPQQPEATARFHHSKSLRKEELERRRRRRKREWLQKMYKEGMEEARRIAASLPDGGGDAVGEVSGADQELDSAAGDEGIDALLSWTEQLDFDGYYNNWLSIATSGRSDRSFFADAQYFEEKLDDLDDMPSRGSRESTV